MDYENEEANDQDLPIIRDELMHMFEQFCEEDTPKSKRKNIGGKRLHREPSEYYKMFVMKNMKTVYIYIYIYIGRTRDNRRRRERAR